MTRFRAWIRARMPHIVITALILLFLAVLLAPRVFIVIGPGEAGVLYAPLYGGTVVDHVYSEGLWIIAPWNRMYIYNTRIQETHRALDVLTRDGLMVKLDLSIRFHPDVTMLGALHQAVGPDYPDKIIMPEVLAAVRREVGDRLAQDLYANTPPVAGVNAPAPTTAPVAGTPPYGTLPATRITPVGQPVTNAIGTPPMSSESASATPALDADDLTLARIVATAGDRVSRKYLVIDSVVLVQATLPPALQRAIERKLEQKQIAEAQLYRIQAAQLEVQVQTLQAQANTALSASLTPDLIRWKGIDATKELAGSPNSKVIVFGNAGATGLPLLIPSEKP